MPTRSGWKHRSYLWTPKSFGSSIYLWFDASDVETLVTSGSSVTTWKDKSPYCNHFVQATGANQPGFHVSTSPTDYAYLDFTINPPNTYMQTTNAVAVPSGALSRAMLAVYTPKSTATAVPYFSYGYGAPKDAFGIANYGGHDPYLACYSADCDSGIPYVTNVRIMATATYNAGTQSISKNGGTASTAANVLTTSTDQLCYVCGSAYSNGQQHFSHEMILIGGNISPPSIAKVEGYLAWKWGLQTSLPSTHQYALNPPRLGM